MQTICGRFSGHKFKFMFPTKHEFVTVFLFATNIIRYL